MCPATIPPAHRQRLARNDRQSGADAAAVLTRRHAGLLDHETPRPDGSGFPEPVNGALRGGVGELDPLP